MTMKLKGYIVQSLLRYIAWKLRRDLKVAEKHQKVWWLLLGY